MIGVMSDLVVNALAIAAAAFIVWWFWLSKPKSARAQSGIIEILVDNGVYTPARIEVPAGQPVTLRFIRKDASPCAEKVLFNDFSLGRDLPLNTPVDITLTPEAPGEYAFTCQMQMYRGALVVK
jgi:plastocyanin domain-containing protein